MENNHPTTNYNLIFGILIAALVVSLVLAVISSGPLVIGLIFAIAAVKAYLVLTKFMHLSLEPLWVKIGMGVLVFLLLLVFIGFYPDVVMVFGGEAGS